MADFWPPFWGFGTSWERFGDGIDFLPFSGGKSHPFGVPFWHPKSKNVATNTKKQCPESGAEKRVLPEVARIGPMCDPYSKYHMFREAEQSPFSWIWAHMGSLLESLLTTSCKKRRSGGVKHSIKNRRRKLMQKGTSSTSEETWWGGCGPLKD